LKDEIRQGLSTRGCADLTGLSAASLWLVLKAKLSTGTFQKVVRRCPLRGVYAR